MVGRRVYALCPFHPYNEIRGPRVQHKKLNNGTKLSSGNLYLDVSSGKGVVDLSSSDDKVTVNSIPEQTSAVFQEGSTVIIQASCDGDGPGQTDMYDGWFAVKLEDGAKVYEIDFEDLVAEPGGYSLKWSTATPVGIVRWSAGTTPYWDIGSLGVYPRASKSYITFSAVYAGTVLSTITNGTTFDTTTTCSSDVTLTDTDETVQIWLEADATNINYGLPMMTITKDGEVEKRSAFLIMATNMTAMTTSQ